MALGVPNEEYDEALVASIRQMTRIQESMTLDLDIALDHGTEHWVIECERVRAYRIGGELACSVRVETDHVLLAPYVDANVTLATHGPVSDVRQAIADLWRAHRDLAGDWFPMSEFVRAEILQSLLESNNAVVAEGPSRFINAYRDALAANGTDAYTPWQRAPVQWRDGAWLPEATDLAVLVLEPHFVVGSRFTAHRATTPGQP